MLRKSAGLAALFSLFLPAMASAQEASLDSGDTAWMLTATALVLFMTVPGLALFYGGMVRSKNLLSVMMQCFAITGLISVLWVLFGYSLAFDTTGMEEGVLNFSSFVGGLDKAFLSGLSTDSLVGTFPESIFITFQMTFAIITPALIAGAFAERMKFSSMLVFMSVWFLVVYAPIAHMVWSGNGALMWDWGVLDFAGGTVVHMTSGWTALVLCMILGPRKGYGTRAMLPHSMVLTMVGTGMLWVGWYGFNAGSAVASDGIAANAFMTTTLAAAVASAVWPALEWITRGKPTVLGFCSGAVAGLVVITPGAGFVSASSAVFIGVLAGVVPYFACTKLKQVLKYDDALDTFGVHGVGGTMGALLTGFFATTDANANLATNLKDYVGGSLWIEQLKAMGVTIVWSVVATVVIAFIVKAVLGLRADAETEEGGLDQTDHGELGYHFDEAGG